MTRPVSRRSCLSLILAQFGLLAVIIHFSLFTNQFIISILLRRIALIIAVARANQIYFLHLTWDLRI